MKLEYLIKEGWVSIEATEQPNGEFFLHCKNPFNINDLKFVKNSKNYPFLIWGGEIMDWDELEEKKLMKVNYIKSY